MWRDGFFTNVAYGTADWARYFEQFVGDGVFPNPANGLMVTESSGMQIALNPGAAFCKGRYCHNDAAYPMTLDIGDGTLARTDRIALRLDLASGSFRPVYLKGIANSTPQAPALTRNDTVYELSLALISVPAGATSIAQADITDTRSDADACGWATMLPGELDTTDLFAQYNDAFTTWFDEIKGQLSEDAAGNLQNQINGIRKVALVGSDTADFSGWYKVAEQTCTNNGNANIVFAVAETFSYNGARRNRGILELGIRSNSTNGNITCEMLRWSTRIGFNVSDFIVVINAMTWTLYAKSINRYSRICFEMLSYSGISSRDLAWPLTFQDNTTKESTDPVATVVSSDGNFFVHSKSGTVHALTGILPTSGTCELTFKATAGYTYGDTFTLNNTAYTATKANGTVLNTDDFIAGAIVSVNVDVTSKKLFFKLGGISAGMYANHQFFAANGTFTVPKTGKYHVTVVGAGGPGGSGYYDEAQYEWHKGGSGGSGGIAIKDVVLTKDAAVAVTAGFNSNASFGSYCTAAKGDRGTPYNSEGEPGTGAGGTASGGDENYTGIHGVFNSIAWNYPGKETSISDVSGNAPVYVVGEGFNYSSVNPSGSLAVKNNFLPSCGIGGGAMADRQQPGSVIYNGYLATMGGVLIEWN